MKLPHKTLNYIAQHLPGLAAPAKKTTELPQDKEFTIDELARASDTTVRNIRAYQDRGLLPPPELRGRKGYYFTSHLARLRVIAGLLDRGYSLNSIKDLIDALENGIDLRHLMGLESAMTSPWTDEEQQLVPMTELIKMFGAYLTPEALARAADLDLMRPEGTMVRVRSMRTLRAGAELVATGIPLEELLDIVRMLRGNVERVANELVRLVGDHVLSNYETEDLPPKEEFPKLADLVWRLRPLAEMAVHAELARAMENAASRLLSDRLEKIIERIAREKDGK
ncbi:MerR family transcriptional regulator [Ketobacter sp.]|uniref:MerR family transcriptional regulator n=1 Tax=Ketobacter sp. TaxID=2083498 RepID=UPI000F10AD92|nr:MerR family transcriptional regulator [Ketobacter sp.]MEE2731311.1 MerR family transcriptional regulator [Pseudomonadota bacterium]RLT94407.1 MAG: MerR family transcriptional regulator [Ketobacter sp.]